MAVVLVGVFVHSLEVAVELWLLEGVQEEIPLLHEPVGPHVDCRWVQIVLKSLSNGRITVTIRCSIDWIS